MYKITRDFNKVKYETQNNTTNKLQKHRNPKRHTQYVPTKARGEERLKQQPK